MSPVSPRVGGGKRLAPGGQRGMDPALGQSTLPPRSRCRCPAGSRTVQSQPGCSCGDIQGGIFVLNYHQIVSVLDSVLQTLTEQLLWAGPGTAAGRKKGIGHSHRVQGTCPVAPCVDSSGVTLVPGALEGRTSAGWCSQLCLLLGGPSPLVPTTQGGAVLVALQAQPQTAAPPFVPEKLWLVLSLLPH